MKTSRMTYCLLAALTTLAAAQEPAPPPHVKTAARGKAIIVTRDENGKEETKTIELGDGGGEGQAIGNVILDADTGAIIGGAVGGTSSGTTGGTSSGATIGFGSGATSGFGGGTTGSDGIFGDGPAIKLRELAEPVRWAIGGDAFDGLARSGPLTFLGVSAIPVPHELAVHLPIAEDTGLGIEGVVPGSPAEKAGLQKSDVLMKLDDQILIHPRQLNVLVANHKEGDNVKLTYLRKGEVKDVSVALGKHDVPPGEATGDVMFHSFGGGAPLRTFSRSFAVPGTPGDPRAEDIQRHIQDQLQNAKENLEKRAEDMRLDATAKVSEAKERLDTRLEKEVHSAAEAAYSAEVQRAAEDELRRAKAAADAAEAETRKEIDELRNKVDAVLKLLEEKK